MKKLFVALLVIVMMAAEQSAATAQQTQTAAEEIINIEFTAQIGCTVSYSVFELAEIIIVGHCPTIGIDSIMESFEQEFPDNFGEYSVIESRDEIVILQSDESGIISIFIRTTEDGWIESDPQQQNKLLNLTLLIEISKTLLEME